MPSWSCPFFPDYEIVLIMFIPYFLIDFFFLILPEIESMFSFF